MADAALLILRVVVGGLLMGHGAQKLFGWFGGHGLTVTAGWLESLGMRPGALWATVAGSGELAGGALMALGFLSPLGPILVMAAMLTAWMTAHWGKPIWVTAGGGEFPLTNFTVALALALAGPGAYAVDAVAGIDVPPLVSAIFGAVALASVVVAVASRSRLRSRATGDRGADRAA